MSAVYLQQFPSYSNHNCKKSSFLRTPAFIFCFPWGRLCGNHAKRCMNVKTIQCLPNSSQHVLIYLQQFLSYSNRKCKKRNFHILPPTFLFPLETPLRLSRNMLHGWKDNSMLAKPIAHVPIYLQQFPSYSNRKCNKSPFSRTTDHTFVSPGDAPAIITQYIAWMERQFNACQTPRSMYPSIFRESFTRGGPCV